MINFRFFRAAAVGAFVALATFSAKAQQTMPAWLLVNQNSQESFFVTDPTERSRLTKAGWKINATAGLLPQAQANAVGMQRLVKGSPSGNDRIFAITPEQATAATKAGYNSEGVMGFVAATQLTPNMVPVYHFTKENRNLWIIDKADQAWAEKNGWKLKGTAFWVWPKTGA